MSNMITRAAVALGASAALSTLGVAGAGAAGAVTQSARQAPSLAASPARAVPGGPLWVQRYNGPGNGWDEARSVAVSPDGKTVFVTGQSENTTSGYDYPVDYLTVAYSVTSGAKLWAQRYDGPAGKADVPASMAVSPDGSTVFVTGSSETSKPETEHEGFFTDYATVAYSTASGARLWVQRYNGPAGLNDGASSVAVARDGAKVFVTGGSEGDYATIAYSPATGARLWVQRYDHGSAASVVSPGNGKVYVTGTSRGDYATVAYGATSGARLWVQRYNGPANLDDYAARLAANPAGTKIFVTGTSETPKASAYATVAYDASSGAQLWVRRYNGPASVNGIDEARSVAVARDGAEVFVTGSSFAGMTARYDYATVAYSTTSGARLWVQRYNPGNGFDDAYSVATGNGKVYVTGSSSPTLSSHTDYATIAYSAGTGAPLWTGRYDGPASGPDVAYSVAVNPAGTKVFVTGQSFGDTGIDYATIAYSG
jgi:DNA-binding beta-propeller fold protein YncE